MLKPGATNAFKRIFPKLPGPDWLGRQILIGLAAGIVSGLGALLFFFLLDFSTHLFLENLAGYCPPAPPGETDGVACASEINRLWLFLVPAIGGLGAGIIVYTFAPESEGHGTDAVIRAYHQERSNIRARIPLVKAIASAVTIGSGGSAGREGPIIQIGAGLGSNLARLLKLSERDRRIFLVAGAAGGIGSIFRAPLGGALFAVEVLYRDTEFESEGVIASIISSLVGYSIFSSVYGWNPIFSIPPISYQHPSQLFIYAVLGLILAWTGWLYVRSFYGLKSLFSRLRIPAFLKPGLGGLAVGLIALIAPQALGMGYGYLQQAINGELAVTMMLAIALVKILSTSFTVGSGGSGGVFAPSLFIGGMVGGAFAGLAGEIMPAMVPESAACILVGMGGMLAGIGKVPIAALILVAEMSAGYQLLVPMMFVSTISYLLTSQTQLYREQVSSKLDSPAHQGEFYVDILEGIQVRNLFKRDRELFIIPEDTHLDDIIDMMAETTQNYFPVVNREGDFSGIFSVDDVRKLVTQNHLNQLIIAKDIATADVISLTPDEDLAQAMGKFTVKNLDDLPVVDRDNPKKLLGMLSRREALNAYNQKAAEARRGTGRG